MYKSDEIKSALLVLIKGADASKSYSTLVSAVAVANRLAIRLTGEDAALNPLLWLSQDNPPEYAALIDFVHTKRQTLGLDPLDPDKGGFKKNPYQAAFMAEGRLRRGRASRIENMMRPNRDKLIGNSRMEFERSQQALWKKQRDASIEAHKKANEGRMTREEFKVLITRFWAAVDTAIDEKEAEARRKNLGL